ncbi:MAG: glycerol-3-phosphate 1-O-acyltransferase PlsY [Acidobacteria bacterium]|nr:glycerol-3-phosphate 1-O-acyltransferase PlsY [Acidobacteriota bacterium]
MSPALAAAAAFLAGYLPGSVPFGLLLVRALQGKDLRAHGSGNIGATNALRTAGKGIGIATLALDVLKGSLGFLLALEVGSRLGAPWPLFWATFAPVAGHCFPLWLRFAGGKGVATALGVLALAEPRVLGLAVLVFFALAVPTRRVSLGSLGAAATAAVAAFALPGDALGGGLDRGLPWGILAVAAIVVWRHRSNLGRLLRGTEPPIGKKAEGPDEDRR